MPLHQLRLCLAAIMFAASSLTATAAVAADALTLELLAERARLAISYIRSIQQADGFFLYEYDFVTGRGEYGGSEVRQAAAAFVLAEYAGFFLDQPAAESVELSLAGLGAVSVEFEDGMVVSKSGVAADADTGATAFALLAELTYFNATGRTGFAEHRSGWLRALLQLQKPGGGFRRRPGTEKEADYYNGETWLALAHYHRLFPDDARVTAALARADAYLIDRYGPDPGRQFGHWGLMAGAYRYLTDGDARMLDFLTALSEKYLAELRPKLHREVNACSMVEGFAAAAAAFSAAGVNEGLIERMATRSEQELANAFEMQLLPGQTRIDLGPDRYLAAPDIDDYAGAFLNGRSRPLTRIDVTQHCVSAMMKYIAFMRSRG